MPRTITNEVKQQMREFYCTTPITISDLAKKFGVSSPTAGKICKDLPRWSKTQLFSPNLQEDWFNCIDCEAKAYFLGLFIADGNVCITTKAQPMCSLTLQDADSYILEEWLKLTRSNRKVTSDERGCSQATIISSQMAHDLAQYGVVPQKSTKTYLPKIDAKLMPHLIRGILDGDGNIEAKWHLFPDGRYRFKHKIAFCGSRQLMHDINVYLQSTLSLDVHREVYDYTGRDLSEIQYSNYHDIELILRYLYADAHYFLNRKYDLMKVMMDRIKERQQCAN